MKQPTRIARVPLSQVIFNPQRNVRDPDAIAESYDDPNMRDSLASIGQQTTAKLLKTGPDSYEPIQGNRRLFNLKALAEQGVIDPKTAKRNPETGDVLRDEDGKPIGGKPFEFIDAEVYEGISDRERVDMLVDHGQIRSLNKLELQRAVEFLLEVGKSEKDAVIHLNGLLQQHYPPSRKIKDATIDGGTDLLNYYRGVIQTMKEAWRAPEVVHSAWMDKLRQGRAWPLKSELNQACSIFHKEVDQDKTGRLNRKNPGPKFQEYWNGVVAKHTKAEAAGEKRAKASSMMNHSQVNEKVIDSRTLKAFRAIILRNIPEDQLPLLDQGLLKFESGEITKEEYSSVLDNVFETLQTAEEAAAEVKVETPTVAA